MVQVPSTDEPAVDALIPAFAVAVLGAVQAGTQQVRVHVSWEDSSGQFHRVTEDYNAAQIQGIYPPPVVQDSDTIE